MIFVKGPAWLFYMLLITDVSIFVTISVFWIRSMYFALEACHPAARMFHSANAWLILIPGFGLVWQFIVNRKAAEALAREYRSRGWESEEHRPGFELGALACTLLTLDIVARIVFTWMQNDEYHFTAFGKIFTFFSLGQPAFSFMATVIVSIFMYRHFDRLNAYVERLDKEAARIREEKPVVTPLPVQPVAPAAPNIQQPLYPPEWNIPPQQQFPFPPQQIFPKNNPSQHFPENETDRWAPKPPHENDNRQ